MKCFSFLKSYHIKVRFSVVAWLISTCSWLERSNQRGGVPNLQELINAEGVEGTIFTITLAEKKSLFPTITKSLEKSARLRHHNYIGFGFCHLQTHKVKQFRSLGNTLWEFMHMTGWRTLPGGRRTSELRPTSRLPAWLLNIQHITHEKKDVSDCFTGGLLDYSSLIVVLLKYLILTAPQSLPPHRYGVWFLPDRWKTSNFTAAPLKISTQNSPIKSEIIRTWNCLSSHKENSPPKI